MSFRSLFLSRLSLCPILGVALTLPTMKAQELTWDADDVTSGVQDGSGTWSVGGTNWYNGAANVPWAVDSTVIAVFGAGGTLGSSNRVVTIDGEVSAGGIRFDPIASGSEAYILNGGTINLQDNAVLEIVDGATSSGGNNRIRLNSDVTGNNISILKTGTDGTTLGSMQLHNAKSWTGTLTLEDLTTNPNESLFVEVFSADALNTLDAVHIKSNSVMTISTGNEVTTDFILDSLAGRGAIRLDVDNTHLSGTITSNVASTISVNNAGHSTRLSGVLDGVASLNIGTVDKAGTYLIDGVIAGSGGITLNEGTVILAGENTSTGSIRITKGEVIVANEGALNSAAPMNVEFISGSSAKTFTLDGYDTTVGSLIGSGSTINVQNGAATDATLTITGTGISFAGTINDGAGGGKLNLEYRGNSTGSRYALSGTNTFTGDVAITQGTLIARSNNNSLGAAPLVTVAQGARLELDSNVTITGKHLITPYLVGANGTNTWDGTVQVAAGGTNATFEATTNNTLVVNGEINGTNPDGQLSDISATGNGTVIMNGDIVNARRLVKNGSGTWVLGGE